MKVEFNVFIAFFARKTVNFSVLKGLQKFDLLCWCFWQRNLSEIKILLWVFVLWRKYEKKNFVNLFLIKMKWNVKEKVKSKKENNNEWECSKLCSYVVIKIRLHHYVNDDIQKLLSKNERNFYDVMWTWFIAFRNIHIRKKKKKEETTNMYSHVQRVWDAPEHSDLLPFVCCHAQSSLTNFRRCSIHGKIWKILQQKKNHDIMKKKMVFKGSQADMKKNHFHATQEKCFPVVL